MTSIEADRIRFAFLDGWRAARGDDEFSWDRVRVDSAYATGHREQQFAAASGCDTRPFKHAFNYACFQQVGQIFLTGLPNMGVEDNSPYLPKVVAAMRDC